MIGCGKGVWRAGDADIRADEERAGSCKGCWFPERGAGVPGSKAPCFFFLNYHLNLIPSLPLSSWFCFLPSATVLKNHGRLHVLNFLFADLWMFNSLIWMRTAQRKDVWYYGIVLYAQMYTEDRNHSMTLLQGVIFGFLRQYVQSIHAFPLSFGGAASIVFVHKVWRPNFEVSLNSVGLLDHVNVYPL